MALDKLLDGTPVHMTEYSHGSGCGCGCNISPMLLDEILKSSLTQASYTGLLVAVAPDSVADFLDVARQHGMALAPIGELQARTDGPYVTLRG